MKIKDKTDSLNQIKKLGLNRVPEIVSTKQDKDQVEKFLDKYKADIYVIRDVESAMGKYSFVQSKEECLKKINNYSGRFSLAVSVKSYPGRLLIGDIFVSGDNVQLSYSQSLEATHRSVENSIYAPMYDDRLWNIPGFSDLIKYITDKNLMNVIVEFAVYDHPVGTKKEKVLVTELRTDY